MSWGDEYVMGASLPGCPLFATGRTQRVAWGVTYLKGDTIDFFIEDCRRGGETAWQYRRRDSWYDFRVREEVIHRKGTDAETVRVYYNPQGTLESDPDRYGSGYHLSLAWTGNADGAGHAMATWLEIVGADSTRSAMEVASRCVQPSLCWILADVDGHMQQLQYDLVSVHARDLLNAWLPHMRDSDVKRRLMHWDYRFDPDSIEASLFQNLYRNVMMEVFGHEAGVGWRRMLYLCTRAGFSTMVLTAADKILGCHATPFQGHVMQTAKRETTFSPSYHFVTDLNTDHAWTNLPGGPSESRFSRYYKSDIDLWFQGKYKQLNVRSD